MSGSYVQTWLADRQLLWLADREWPWLVAPLLLGAIVVAVYLFTHPYPGYGAGLYLEIADRIAANGYRPPERIPHYTADGVPFAYPPLMFYVSAVLMDVGGVDPLALSLYVPAAVTVAYLVPYYFTARGLLDSRVDASLATGLLAVSPPVLQWHLSAGGLVRGSAFLLTLCGLAVGVRLFRTGALRWLLPGALLFGLTVLTHPVYAVFFGGSYLLLYAGLDRSPRGLLLGAAVAAGGLVLAAPWVVWAASVHGLDVFTSAAGTHTGLFGGLDRIADQFGYTLVVGPPLPLFFVLVYAGVAYFLRKRRFLLPALLVVPALVIGKERFQFVAGAMMAAVFLRVAVGAAAQYHLPTGEWRRVARVVLVGVLLAALGLGALYGAGALPEAHAGSPSQPQFMDAADREAMAWAANETSPDAEFVVLGDAAEWFPFYTNRTILVGPWGVEWTTPERYETQLELYRQISECDTSQCLTTALSTHGVDPDYVYVPREPYTVRGIEEDGTTRLRQDLRDSGEYELVFVNDGVSVFRQSGDMPEPGADVERSTPRVPPGAERFDIQ